MVPCVDREMHLVHPPDPISARKVRETTGKPSWELPEVREGASGSCHEQTCGGDPAGCPDFLDAPSRCCLAPDSLPGLTPGPSLDFPSSPRLNYRINLGPGKLDEELSIRGPPQLESWDAIGGRHFPRFLDRHGGDSGETQGSRANSTYVVWHGLPRPIQARSSDRLMMMLNTVTVFPACLQMEPG
jgi:hypothetical protein